MKPWQSLNAQVRAAGLAPEAEQGLRFFWQREVSGPTRTFVLRPGPLPSVPPGAGSGAWPVMERTVAAQWHGNDLWIEGRLYAHISAEGAELVWNEAAAPTPEMWMLALTEAHRAGGWLPLHAATLSRNGQAVAVSGVSGAGKSTATLRLWALGYTVLAEDRTFWHAESGVVSGFDRHLRTFDDSLERFAPQHLAQAHPRDSKGKRLLPLTPEAGTDTALHASLQALLLLRPEPEHDLSSAERVRTLWEASGFALTELGRAQVQRGVQHLLPLLRPRTVSRETVLPTVQGLLDRQTAP